MLWEIYSCENHKIWSRMNHRERNEWKLPSSSINRRAVERFSGETFDKMHRFNVENLALINTHDWNSHTIYMLHVTANQFYAPISKLYGIWVTKDTENFSGKIYESPILIRWRNQGQENILWILKWIQVEKNAHRSWNQTRSTYRPTDRHQQTDHSSIHNPKSCRYLQPMNVWA